MVGTVKVMIFHTVYPVQKVLSKDDTRRFCLFDLKAPKKREYEKFGRTQETYDPIGRVHLDSLELYLNTHMKKDTHIPLDAHW